MAKRKKASHHVGPKPAFAVNLANCRNARGMSQYELEDKSGVPRPTIAALELGHHGTVELSTLQKLANALGVTVWHLAQTDEDRARAEEVIGGALDSDELRAASPTEDEKAWLRSVATLSWTGDKPPTARSVLYMLLSHRESR